VGESEKKKRSEEGERGGVKGRKSGRLEEVNEVGWSAKEKGYKLMQKSVCVREGPSMILPGAITTTLKAIEPFRSINMHSDFHCTSHATPLGRSAHKIMHHMLQRSI